MYPSSGISLGPGLRPHFSSTDFQPAENSDVEQFENFNRDFNLSSSENNRSELSPFAIQPNRLTSSPKKINATTDVIQSTAEFVKKLRDTDSALLDQLQDVPVAEFDARTSLIFHHKVHNLGNMTEIVSKGVNKGVQAAQTVIKNQ